MMEPSIVKVDINSNGKVKIVSAYNRTVHTNMGKSWYYGKKGTQSQQSLSCSIESRDEKSTSEGQYEMLHKLRGLKKTYDQYLVKQRNTLSITSARLHEKINASFSSLRRESTFSKDQETVIFKPSVKPKESAQYKPHILNCSKYSKEEIQKYADTLKEAMELVNLEKTEQISLEVLGQFFQIIGVYKALNETAALTRKPLNSSQQEETRRRKEIQFHKNFWSLLAKDSKGLANVETVVDVLLVLYTADPNKLKETVLAIEHVLKVKEKDDEDDWEVDPEEEKITTHWTATDLIDAFKDLTTVQQRRVENRIPFLFQPIVSSPKGYNLEKGMVGTVQEEHKNPTASHAMTPRNMTKIDSETTEPTHKLKSRNNQLITSNSTGNLRGNNNSIMSRISMLYEKHQLTKQKIRKKRQELEDHEMKQCTFHPDLTQSTYNGCLAEQATKKVPVNRGSGNIMKRLKAMKAKKPRKTEGNVKKTEAVRVEVAIAPGKTDTIIIHKGDNVLALVDKFAKQHSLTEGMKAKLRSMLNTHTKLINST